MAKALNYYDVEDVQALLGISSSKAYKIIRELNMELKKKGFIVVMGRVPKRYFNEKFYCDTEDLQEQLVSR
jgi:hypothetical protein